MKLNARELLLVWLTVTVVLFGGTYYFGAPRWDAVHERADSEEGLQHSIELSRRLVSQETEWQTRLDEILATLPKYPANQDVTSQLLKMLQQTADKHGLILLRRVPDKERRVGDLFETAISCTWEGELEPLVRFLYDLQSQGAIVDLRELSVSPAEGQGNRLKGSFKVDCAYSRESVENS